MLIKTVGSHKKADSIFYYHFILTTYSITVTRTKVKKNENLHLRSLSAPSSCE